MKAQLTNRLVLCFVAMVLILGSAQAASFLETGDAGALPETAQEVLTFGNLSDISGRIDHAFDVDLFRLVIHDPSGFSATTDPADTTAYDLQMFLFDAWGAGIVAVDDWDSSPLPQVPVGTLSNRLPGIYLLAVSPEDDDPLGPFGEIFPDLDSGICEPIAGSVYVPLIGWTRDFTAAGGSYSITFTGAAGLLEPLPADFDEDGDVDGADLARWQAGYGIGTLHTEGDADGDLDVDGNDYLIWQRQYGSSVPLGANTAVPEPGTLLLILFATVKTCFQRSTLRGGDHRCIR